MVLKRIEHRKVVDKGWGLFRDRREVPERSSGCAEFKLCFKLCPGAGAAWKVEQLSFHSPAAHGPFVAAPSVVLKYSYIYF